MKRQYSIRFLLFEVFLFACAFGLIRCGFVIGGMEEAVFRVAALIVIGAAIGGILGNFAYGVAAALGTLLVVLLFAS